jgi:hypothetical protein
MPGSWASRSFGATTTYVPNRLKAWGIQQLAMARHALQRARAAGRSLQDGTWRVGEPPPFGLQVPGDSVLPVALWQSERVQVGHLTVRRRSAPRAPLVDSPSQRGRPRPKGSRANQPGATDTFIAMRVKILRTAERS